MVGQFMSIWIQMEIAPTTYSELLANKVKDRF